ncbi:ATP-binding cassette permease mdl1 [Elasticomyces elasticus]|nr:ATP-binding cassette permease mdl1 [Elasticomyces elasticus]
MRCSHALKDLHKAWCSPGNGALYSSISTTCSPRPLLMRSPILHFASRRGISGGPLEQLRKDIRTITERVSRERDSVICRKDGRPSREQIRPFATSKILAEAQRSEEKPSDKDVVKSDDQDVSNAQDEGFARSDKASQAAQVNLSAKLSKEGDASNTSGRQEIWRLLKIARPEVKALSVAVVFLLISSSITMVLPFSIGKILDIATQSADAEGSGLPFGLPLQTFYIALGTLLTLGAAANYTRIIILRIVGERVVSRLRTSLYRRTFIQDAEFFDANRVGDLISRLGSDTIIVGKSITQNVSDGLRSAISAIAGLSLMGYVSLKLTGVLALMFPPVAIGAFFYGRAIRNLSRQIQKSLGSLTKIAEERLGNVRTSQAFVGEQQEVGRYNKQVRDIFNLGKKEAYLSATFFGASGWAGNMTFLALLWVGGGLVKSGDISVGELTSFLMYTGYAGSALFGLSGFYSELMKGVGAASRLFELQDREPSISPTKGLPVPNARGDIAFRNVSFAYPTRPAVTIFKDLDFTIKEGTNVAVVAPSGAGKSTIASLLLRFYSPSSGTITIGGKDISGMNAKRLRRRIGYVGQEPVLFSGTIAENIAYGRPNAKRSEIVQAARKANCGFISDFPDGLETFAGARGTQLSGGQKQRIAIARALLKNPDILILDEATSALDAESETLVNQALHSLLQQGGHITTISIAHRLSTIKRADTIVCIGSDGRVAEVGNYRELSGNPDGPFSKLMDRQISGGDVDVPGREIGPVVTEEEELKHRVESALDDARAEGVSEEEGQVSGVVGENVSAGEAVAERTRPTDR